MTPIPQSSLDTTTHSRAVPTDLGRATGTDRTEQPSSSVITLRATTNTPGYAPAGRDAGEILNAPVVAASQPPAPAPVAVQAEDTRALLQFVASTKPAEQPVAPAAPAIAPCIIPQAITFKGDAMFRGDAVIEGEFQGTLRVANSGSVRIAKTGMVEGEIHGRNVHVDGSVTGELNAIGGLASFGPNANCTGQINYSRLAIEEGAEIEASMKRVQAHA